MEIGPIAGIRPVQPVQADRTARDLSGVFRIEFQREQQQDSYVPHRERSERGLEDEEDEHSAENETPEAEASGISVTERASDQISLFA